MNFADPIGGDPLMNIGRPVTNSKIYGISPAWMEGSLLARYSIYLPIIERSSKKKFWNNFDHAFWSICCSWYFFKEKSTYLLEGLGGLSPWPKPTNLIVKEAN